MSPYSSVVEVRSGHGRAQPTQREPVQRARETGCGQTWHCEQDPAMNCPQTFKRAAKNSRVLWTPNIENHPGFGRSSAASSLFCSGQPSCLGLSWLGVLKGKGILQMSLTMLGTHLPLPPRFCLHSQSGLWARRLMETWRERAGTEIAVMLSLCFLCCSVLCPCPDIRPGLRLVISKSFNFSGLEFYCFWSKATSKCAQQTIGAAGSLE